MTHDLSAHPARPASRWTRRIATLAIAVVTAALAVPAVTAAQPIPADPGSSYPATHQTQQSGPTEPGAPSPGTSDFGGGQATQTTGNTVFTGSVTAVAHQVAPADTSVVLRRDSTKADPFVASVGGTPTATASDDGFAWGDAAMGAGAALGVIALAGIGALALRRRGGLATRSVPTGS